MFAGAGWSQIQIFGVANAASYEPGVPSGGSLGYICALGLAGPAGLTKAAPNSPLPFQLAGVQVTVNGAPAPLLSVLIGDPSQFCDQIFFQVPLERDYTIPNGQPDVGGTLTVTQGTYSATLTPTPAPNWVGFFQDANGHAVAQHASDYSPVNETSPAAPGEWIIVYATGFTVAPEPPIGIPTPSQPLFRHYSTSEQTDPLLFLQAQAPDAGGAFYANTSSVQIAFEGLTPGLIGVFQINMQVPETLATGDLYLFFNRGSCANGGQCFMFGSTSSTSVIVPVHYRLKRLKYSATASE
jgi:uncharacterized protein (TIGR03437 family)